MSLININLFDCLEIGDSHPIVIMGVINLSPESFFKGSVLKNLNDLSSIVKNMIQNGAKIIDVGARSTAPWSAKGDETSFCCFYCMICPQFLLIFKNSKQLRNLGTISGIPAWVS